LQRDIAGGGLNESPGFGVEEEFHAAACGMGVKSDGLPSVS
jgi:hypothetical protein